MLMFNLIYTQYTQSLHNVNRGIHNLYTMYTHHYTHFTQFHFGGEVCGGIELFEKKHLTPIYEGVRAETVLLSSGTP